MKFDTVKYYLITDPNDMYAWSPVCVGYGTLHIFDTAEEAKSFGEQMIKDKECEDYEIHETWDDYCWED